MTQVSAFFHFSLIVVCHVVGRMFSIFSCFIDCGDPLLLGGCRRMSGGALVLHFLVLHFLILYFVFFIVAMKTTTTQKKETKETQES